jgi:hypothetical protein
MSVVDEILSRLNYRELARHVDVPYTAAREDYHPPIAVVTTFAEYAECIGDFYNYVQERCITPGTRRTRADAIQESQRLLEHQLRREGGMSAGYDRALTGEGGGLSSSFDHILEALKQTATDNFVRSVLQEFFAPVRDYATRREIARELCARIDPQLAPELHRDSPDAAAHDLETLITTYTQMLRELAKTLRRY